MQRGEQDANEKWREGLDEVEYSKSVEEYIMNRVKGKPKWYDDDSIK